MKFVNPQNPLRQASSQSAQTGAVPAGQQRGARTVPVAAPTPVIQKFASRQDEELFEPQGAQGGIFNPKRFAGYKDDGAVRKAVASRTDRMYNGQGEMNAWDKKDAFRQTSYLMDAQAQVPTGRMYRQASKAELDEKRQVLAAALSDPSGEGFALVGQELALPIKAILDYEGWIRKIFRVRTLAQGELFRIPKDVRATAYVVGGDGQSIESRPQGFYVLPDEAMITSYPEVPIMEIYQVNFDVLDRMQDTARQEIQLEEDKRGLRLLDRGCLQTNAVSTFSTVSLSVLENLRYQIERHRLIVDKYLINRAELSDIEINMSGTVDPVTQREWNLAGYVGRFLGAHILTASGTPGTSQEVVPAGTIYCVTAPEYLGEMGIRIELFAEPYNRFPSREAAKGWAFLESCGFGLPNTRSCAKAVKG